MFGMSAPLLQLGGWMFLAFVLWVVFAAFLRAAVAFEPLAAVVIAAVVGWVGAGLLLHWLVPGFGTWAPSWFHAGGLVGMR